MRKTFVLSILFAAIIAGCISNSQPTVTPTPMPVQLLEASKTPTSTPISIRCVDTDEKNYSSAATTTLVAGESTQVQYKDSCNNSTLTEYYCSGSEVKNENYTCQYGCENGACKQTPAGPAFDFKFLISPTDIYITTCKAPEITLNVIDGPRQAMAYFSAEWKGKLSGTFNPEQSNTNNQGFAEAKVLASTRCASTGNVTVNFTAKVCTDKSEEECVNKTLSVPFTAGHCLDHEVACDQNESIAG